jgi:MATE family multidrug resistance protein
MNPIAEELRCLRALATPAIVTQLGWITMGVVDTVMVGHLGVDAMGAVSLGHLWVVGTLMIGLGVILGIDPVVSQAHGAGDGRRLGIALQQGTVLAALVSLPIAAAWLATEPALLLLGQAPDLARAARGYVLVQLPSIPFFLAFTALRQYLQGRGMIRPVRWVILLANLMNAFLNWVFIYGHLGAPAMGAVGAGLATSVTRASLLFGLLWIVRRYRLHEGAWVPWSREAFRRDGLVQILRFGLPVGIQIGLEIWAFHCATILAGHLGKTELAASTIVLNLASVSFMVPLGISMGAVTRVGNLIGAGDRPGAQRAAWVALAAGAGVMVVSALVFALGRAWLPWLYTGDPGVIALAAAALPVAAAFQLFDGTQVVGGGILRGMGRTRPAAVFNLIGYYALGLPLAWALGIRAGWGVPGIWAGLAFALFAVALALVLWVWRRGPARVESRVLQ